MVSLSVKKLLKKDFSSVIDLGYTNFFFFFCFLSLMQTVKDFLAEYESKVSPQSRDVHRGYAYDAVWAMALALNRTVSQLAPGTRLDKVPYGDKSLSTALTEALRGTNFSGVTVN